MKKALLAAALLVAMTAVARLALEQDAGRVGRVRNPAWLPDGKTLRLAAFGQRLALADLYWLRLVQYVGETVISKENRWEALYPLADLVTDLDPRFGYAYQVAGSNLSGLANRYEESERILQKGIRNVPERWSLPFALAVNKFLYEGDFAAATRYARQAAEIGHKPHLALLAGNLALVADSEGEYMSAETLLLESIRQADTPGLRGELEERLTKVRTYQVLSRAERAIATFRRNHGRRPASFEELARLDGVQIDLIDPSGGFILYEPTTGEVRSSRLGPRQPLRVTR